MSEWMTDKQAGRKRDDAAARARAAREERQRAQEQQGNAKSEARRVAAAERVQLSARRYLALLEGRPLQRVEWDAAIAAVGASPSAGHQLALCSWLLRFFTPNADGERMRMLSRIIVDGMEQPQAPRMFASAALRKELALHWVSVLTRLLQTACRMIAPSEPHVAELLTEVSATDGSSSSRAGAAASSSLAANSRKRLSVTFGPVLRLLLLLAEPEKWKLITQLAGAPATAPAAQALTLMAQSAVHAAATTLISTSGALAFAVHAIADSSLLGAAVAVAALPLQQPGAPAAEAVRAMVLGGVLSVPALLSRVGTAAGRLGKSGLVWSRIADNGAAIGAHAAAGGHAQHDPDVALCVCANLLSMLPTSPPPSVPQLLGMAKLIEALLRLQPTVGDGSASSSASRGGGGSYFHLVRGWSPRAPSAGIAPHLDSVSTQLTSLWSPKLIGLLYGDALAVPLRTKAVDAAIAALPADAVQALAARAQIGAQLHLTSIKALAPHKGTALARLAYGTLLVPALWSLLCRLDATRASPLQRLSDDVLRDPLSTPSLPLLQLLLEAAAPLLAVLDDKELHEDRTPFSPDSLAHLARYLNRLAFRIIWELTDDAALPHPSVSGAALGSASSISATAAHANASSVAAPANALRRSVRDACLHILSLLAERDARRPFCPDGLWLIPDLRYSELHRELADSKPRAKRLLNSMPWAVPFERRVNIFRELVAKEKDNLPNEALPEHVRGHRIKIRREQLLEDGYVQMGGLGSEALKGTVRVEFVNNLGLAEAGIDRHGVFKEFMEDTAASAFDPNRGLFRVNDAGMLFPSPTSESADPHHMRYFEFVGRMLGKAIYEGIVLDVPLADFLVLKLLGKSATLDELPSLDPALATSLDFLKRYDGDVESDLCLTFSVDEEEFGKRVTVDLKEGGRCVAVTSDNRIEYVHLMADYRLNQQIAAQSKALLHGIQAVVPTGWLRLFNRPELQRLVSGDDVAIDVTDLKRHSKYAGGYNELSPTIRDLWSVISDFNRADRALFLKFVTSCSKPPLLGFAHLHPAFTIQCVASDGGEIPSVLAFFGMGRKETSRLPTASTCFNLLKLPNFKSKKVLREKLLYAIKSESGFDLS